MEGYHFSEGTHLLIKVILGSLTFTNLYDHCLHLKSFYSANFVGGSNWLKSLTLAC